MDHSAIAHMTREESHTQQQSPFFRLPWELRSEIYTEIIDATMHSAPPMSFLRSDNLHEGSHKHHRWSAQCQLSDMDIFHPRQYRCPGAQLLRVCKRSSSDLRQFVASRKEAGKPNSRIDAIALDNALWIPRVTVLPHCPSQGHGVEIHIEISCEVTFSKWERVCMMIAKEVWVAQFIKRGPAFAHGSTKGVENCFVDYITFSIGHCMDECERSRESEGRPHCVNYKVAWDSEESGSDHSIKSEISGQPEGSWQSEISKKPICAHLLELVAQIRSACPSHKTGWTFVIAGQRYTG